MIRKNSIAKILIPSLLLCTGLHRVEKVFGEELKYLTTANLNMRSAPGTNQRILLTIPNGRQMVFVSSKNGWYEVQYGGKQGYVSGTYVRTERVAEPQIRPEATPANGTLKSTAALNMRKGPGTGYGKVGSMPKGAVVSFSEIRNGWYRVNYNGKIGYASGRYLVSISPAGAMPAPAAPMETVPPLEQGSTMKKYITTGTLNMRSGPTKAYPIVQVLPKGAELTYLGESGWYHVSYNGKTGYASNRFVQIIETTVTAPAPPEPEVPPTEAVSEVPVPAPVEPEPSEQEPEVSLPEAPTLQTPTESAPLPVEPVPAPSQGVLQETVLYYTSTTLNMRSGPAAGHPLVLTLPKGVHLRSEGVENGWHKVTYQGKTGYASGRYLGSGTVYLVDGIIFVNKGFGVSSSFNPGVHPEAQSAYNDMAASAAAAGHKLNLFSGFRSYSYQTDLFQKYVKQSGVQRAETYSARAGFSEHQTGLTFDIGGRDSSKWTTSAFGSTSEGQWLASNAPNFGFILRYPQGKEAVTGYVYEPWHFRYVGKDLALKITDSGLTLDEYFNAVRPTY